MVEQNFTYNILERGTVMKKMIRRLFVFMLACMLFASVALSVSAAEVDSTCDLMPIELENAPDAGYVTGARAAGLPFTMYAKNVTSFLSTQASGKCFVPSNYTTLGSTVWATGNFTHSLGKQMKAGVCYYSPSAGKYLPAGSAAGYITSNATDDFAFNEDMRNLLQGTTHYGYVSNYSGTGAVIDGSMTVFLAVG